MTDMQSTGKQQKSEEERQTLTLSDSDSNDELLEPKMNSSSDTDEVTHDPSDNGLYLPMIHTSSSQTRIGTASPIFQTTPRVLQAEKTVDSLRAFVKNGVEMMHHLHKITKQPQAPTVLEVFQCIRVLHGMFEELLAFAVALGHSAPQINPEVMSYLEDLLRDEKDNSWHNAHSHNKVSEQPMEASEHLPEHNFSNPSMLSAGTDDIEGRDRIMGDDQEGKKRRGRRGPPRPRPGVLTITSDSNSMYGSLVEGDEEAEVEVEAEKRESNYSATSDELDKLKKDLAHKEKEILKLVAQEKASGYDYETLEAELEESRNAFEALEKKSQKIISAIEKMQHENTNLQKQLSYHAIMEHDYEKLTGDHDALRHNFRSLDAQYNQVTKTLSEYKSRNDDSNRALEILQLQTPSIQDQNRIIGQLKNEIGIRDLELARLHDVEEKFEDLSERYDSESRAQEEVIAEKKHQIEELKQQLERNSFKGEFVNTELRTALELTTYQVKELQSLNNDLSAENSRCSSTYDDTSRELQQAIADRDMHKQDFLNNLESLNMAETELIKRTHLHEQSEEQAQQLKQQLEDAKNEALENQRRLSGLQRNHFDLEKEIASLLDSGEKDKADAAKSNNKFQACYKELIDTKQLLEELEQKVEKYEKDLVQAKAQVAEAENDALKYQRELEQRELKLEKEIQTVKDGQLQLDKADTLCRDLQAQVERLLTRLREADDKAEVDDQQDEHSIGRQLEEARVATEENKRTAQLYKSQLVSKEKELKNASRAVDLVRDQLNRARTQEKASKKKLQHLREQFRNYRNGQSYRRSILYEWNWSILSVSGSTIEEFCVAVLQWIIEVVQRIFRLLKSSWYDSFSWLFRYVVIPTLLFYGYLLSHSWALQLTATKDHFGAFGMGGPDVDNCITRLIASLMHSGPQRIIRT
jgi:chromosome segregation ATPase